VLVREVVSLLRPGAGGVYVDATVGLGGHASALLGAGAGRVIGIDRDEAALAATRERLAGAGDRVTLLHADYRDLPDVLGGLGLAVVDGILVDLGVSSLQLDDAARGFSFRAAGPLDMRMDRSRGLPLAERLRTADVDTLADVIHRYGEERHARRVARAILAARDRGALQTTVDLARAARRGAGGGRWQRLDPATRTFQALRIWTNDELDRLDPFLDEAARRLAPGGRLAVIAFHSLEDRVVKQAFRRLDAAGASLRLVTRRPVRPGPDEITRNPRARSARLRVLENAA
jgi:16S rRNA (cytosine1402-N4)-methyltransferase